MSKGQPGIANVNLIGDLAARGRLRRFRSAPIARAGARLLASAGALALAQLSRARVAIRARRA